MRVAFVGKGGAGKSALSGTFARLLAESGEQVLALDSDPMPGMAFSLNVPQHDAGIPDEAIEVYEEDGNKRYRLLPGLTGPEVVERYAVRGEDGLRFFQLGKARGPTWDNTRQHFGFQRVLDDLPGAGWSIVGDLPGGTRQPFMTWGRYAQTFLVVVDPTPASLLTGRRLAKLAQMAGAPRVLSIANKVQDPADAELVAERTGLEVIASIPLDPALSVAARAGVGVLDVDRDAPAAAAVRSLVQALSKEDTT